jgi:hypothetical protein
VKEEPANALQNMAQDQALPTDDGQLYLNVPGPEDEEVEVRTAGSSEISAKAGRLKLFDTTTSRKEVMDQIASILPRLATTTAMMKQFINTVKEHVTQAPPYVIPSREQRPRTWASTDQAMDDLWRKAVEEEARLAVPEVDGLDMDVKYLVKPAGSLSSTLMVLGSYPTMDPHSTVLLEYSTTDDLSNVSMFMLYAKLGLHKANVQKSGVLHVDLFPRRIDRKQIHGNDCMMSSISKVLRRFWEQQTDRLLAASSSCVLIVCGHLASERYQDYLSQSKMKHEIVWVTGARRHITKIFAA